MPHETLIKTNPTRTRSVTRTRGNINAAANYKDGVPPSLAKRQRKLAARQANWTGGSKNPNPTKPGSLKKGGGY